MIASVQNPLIKHLVKLRENRHYREEQGQVLITGCKLIREIAAHSSPIQVFVMDRSEAPSCAHTYQVTYSVLKKITGLPSPEPIAATFLLPQQTLLKQLTPLLVLDAIRDPGNLGTLLRTALAFGWKGVFFLPTTVDPFHEKVIRASRGALFRLPWQIGTWEELFQLKDQEKFTAYVADTQGITLNSVRPDNKFFLLLSNEAQGVSARAEIIGQKIAIPMEGDMESLNVAIAGAILMYYLKNE